jgi:hypothetical protein
MTLSERRRYFLLGLLLTATLAVAAVSGIEQSEGRNVAEARQGGAFAALARAD